MPAPLCCESLDSPCWIIIGCCLIVVVGEVYSVNELADLRKRAVTDVPTDVGDQVADKSEITVCVGGPQANSLTATLFKDWSQVSDQRIVIRSRDNGAVCAVGGGSPAATLGAVYELRHRQGIRLLPRGDIDPLEKKPVVDLSKYDGGAKPILFCYAKRGATSSNTSVP
jgi:hypothetical protein